MNEIFARIPTEAAAIASKMTAFAESAQSEEEVRYECNRLLDDFLTRSGIAVRGRHEYSLAGGRVDSKYGGIFIEYKFPHGPGRLSPDANAAGTKAVRKQIEQRFKAFKEKENIAPNRLFAAGLDGRHILFVRSQGGKFSDEKPEPVTAFSVGRLLRVLATLGVQGLAFTPELLTEAFGSGSDLARAGVRTLHDAIRQTTNPKARTFFSQWKILFSEVCGLDVDTQGDKVDRLAVHYGIDTETADPAAMLFAVHSYYAIFIKLLAAEIAASFSPLRTSILQKCASAPTSARLRTEMENLEQGGIWQQLEIGNFLEGDLFAWYLAAWDDNIADALRGMVDRLSDFDPTTLSIDPAGSRDLLKKLYHHLFPRSVRHDLGEYYTPDWLAEYTLDALGYDGNPDTRVLDPSCGSGTFLVMAINRAVRWFEANRHECGYGEAEFLGKLLTNIVGFDLNPLAVMAARTNYLIALRDLLKFSSGIEIPVYLCDSILTNENYGSLFTGADLGKTHVLKTAVDLLNVPVEITKPRQTLGKYTEVIERCIRDSYTDGEFVRCCEDEGLPITEKHLHTALYNQLLTLHKAGKNGIWARIIRNAFAPIWAGKFDLVAGNPPWINWESLPGDYRNDTKPLWTRYGLFTLRAAAARLGGGKKDLSMLFVYACADNYLKEGGKLGFVITQSIFKTKGAGDGFRRFQYGSIIRRTYLEPISVDDLSSMQVFEDATNRTAVFVCKKTNKAFKYPVPYTVWHGPGRVGQDVSLADVLAQTNQQVMGAVPVNAQAPNSPWLTAPAEAATAVLKVHGMSAYRAYAGCCTWLNGIFWVDVLNRISTDSLLIQNRHDVGKIPVEQVQAVVEDGLVFPLLRGRDVKPYQVKPSAHLLLTQDSVTRTGIPEVTMKRNYPKTLTYLKQFEDMLRKRSGFRKYYQPDDPFYSLYNVGSYTMLPWKVLWSEVANSIRAGVTGPSNDKVPIPDHTLIFVPCVSGEEAHYVCALLNSAPAQLAASGYIVLHPSPHVLQHIAIPRFAPTDTAHARLSELSRLRHEAEDNPATPAVEKAVLDVEIDQTAATLWGLDGVELKAIQNALVKVERPRPVVATDEEEDPENAEES